jgi:polyferredoxin
MGNVLFLILAWPALFVLLAVFGTWWYGYASPIDWWYREIDTDPRSGVWYYGTIERAARRER